ncbi:MAG: sugar phosphate isomerase/epimerase family protein [Phycisphaerales bacterium]
MPALAVTAPFGFTFDPVRFLKAYRAAGISQAQFYRNEAKPPTVAQALTASHAAAVPFDSIHGVFGEHIDPTSPDPAERQRCLGIYEAEGKLAVELGGPMVVVHPAKFNAGMRLMDVAEAESMSAPRWAILDQWLPRLAEIGERLGVVYLIENQPRNTPLGHDAPRLAEHVLKQRSPHIRMCYDVGHAHMTGDVVQTVRACAPAIDYLHIHDNDATKDDHRMPGDGTIDWAGFAKVLRETDLKAPRMLEVFYDEPKVESLAAAGLGKRLSAALAP